MEGAGAVVGSSWSMRKTIPDGEGGSGFVGSTSFIFNSPVVVMFAVKGAKWCDLGVLAKSVVIQFS